MSAFRLPAGGRIDRSRDVPFRFDGRDYAGHPGDTLASALLANGVHLVGRSFKYHRPRGILASGAEEPNALVTIGVSGRRTPNLRATQVEIYEGLEAESQNRFPSLERDVGAVAGLAAPALGAGFYYKTFIGPGGAWKRIYEPLIRRAAGLGRAPEEADPDVYTQRYAFCDVLVVGAGAAGLAAARAAAEAGASVLLVDEQNEPGGGLLAERDASARAWLEATLAWLEKAPSVRVLSRTTAFGYFLQNFVGLAERLTDHLADKPAGMARERLWKVRAKRVVLAAGAIERPLVFSNNDRPGIMLAGAARDYANRWAVRAGTRAVVAVTDDSGYASVRDLGAAGVIVSAIADPRPGAGCSTSDLPVRFGVSLTDTQGGLRVEQATLSNGERIGCDLVLMAGGWIPSLHLFSQSRGRVAFDAERGLFLPGEARQDQVCAGACRGVTGIEACIEDGVAAGEWAVRGGAMQGLALPPAGVPLPPPANPEWAFVDFQNDVKVSDVRQAVREGFRSIEHVKRYTTSGMATDQGKTSNINTLAIAADAARRKVPEVGLTTFRMPYTPVTFGTFAGLARGDLFDPVRQTPMHAQAVALGAMFEDVGQWKRAHHFPRDGETQAAAVARECLAVRHGVGLFDGSTLGKIEVVGPDAAEFLNRLYTNDWTKLAPGRCRYGVMLNEAGFVMDDGVIGRLASDRFHVTTTTGGAAHVLMHMEDYRQTEFTDLRVWLVSVTEQWAVITVQGPRARDVIAPLVEGVDLGAFPHMSVAECRVCGVDARLFRVSFTGESGYEINVPAGHGPSVWDAVAKAGVSFGITPYGTEAMHVLRAEKGYIVVGQDTDGTITPDDAGLSWAIGKNKRDFVGRRSLRRPDLVASGRMQLVGLRTEEPGIVLEEGSQIVSRVDARTPIGHVTSSYFSAALDRSIALAMLAGGRGRMGELVRIPAGKVGLAAHVVSPVFYDPVGARLHG